MESRIFKKIDVVEDLSSPQSDFGRISKLERYKVRNQFSDGSFSKTYNLEVYSHKGYDAVGVLPYWKKGDEYYVMLLKSFRPALTFRKIEPEENPFLVEVIAGVIEAGESGTAGIKHRACEEVLEESGFSVKSDDMLLLGSAFYSSPGLYTEKLWLCAIEIDPESGGKPTLDGSVMEEMIQAFPVSFTQAIKMIDDGKIQDAKTEIALSRFERLISRKTAL